MSHVNDLINIVLRSGLAQELKLNGFRKEAHTFRKSLSGVTLITNIQGNLRNHNYTGQFTMNLGVYFPAIAKLSWLPLPRDADKPFEYDCLIRTRIGNLLPASKDYWWTIDSSTDLPELGLNVKETWKTYGQPWLEYHTQLEHARNFLARQGLHWQAALFSYALGEIDLATEQLQKSAENAAWHGNTHFVGTLRDWAKTHQLAWQDYGAG